MTVVVDASVIIKWLIQDPKREAGTDKATRLMDSVTKGDLPILQPVHWVMEVGGVLARASPATAADDVTMLYALEFPIADDPLLLRRGAELAVELKQHLFDTAYHAIALETPGTIFITSDERYFRAALPKGRIAYLPDWESVTDRI